MFDNQSKPIPLPETDPRFPGLRFIPGDKTLKKSDPAYKDRIVTDDDLVFDIFAPTPDPILLKKGKQVELIPISPFSEYSTGVLKFDLEWVGCDGGQARGDASDVIVAIGCEMAGKVQIACNPEKTEKQLLEWFLLLLDTWQPHTLAGHAIYGFYKGDTEVLSDLGLLAARMALYRLDCPWRRVGEKRWRWSNAKENGQSMEAPRWECDLFELIDTLQQTALWDAIYSKLSGYGLKTAVQEMGLARAGDNLDIGADVYKYWASGDVQTIKKYLEQDILYTGLLWDKLMPAKYFQKAYLELSLQDICTTGTGSWWNQYLRSVNNAPYAKGFATASYQGALTFYYAGVWENCVKLDFGAMYPNIIEWLQLCPLQDHEKMNAKTVAFVKAFRKQLKQEMKRCEYGSVEYNNLDGQQATAKVLANSDYGLFNTAGLQFNDPFVGAMVTWAGRQLARFAMQYAVDRGCVVVAVDTDGFICYHPDVAPDDRDEYFTQLEDDINDALPGNNYIEFEEKIDFVWVPPVTKDKTAAQAEHDKKTAFFNNNPLYGREVGLSKNYITLSRDGDGVKVTRKGIFKKRNRSWLEKTFVETFLLLQFNEGLDRAREYYQDVRGQIESGTLPVDKLRTNVLVAKHWVQWRHWGFELGQKYDVHWVIDWPACYTKRGKMRKDLQFMAVADPSVSYSPEYYLAKIDEVYAGLVFEVDRDDQVSDQLGLFEQNC